jgi:DNA-binding beta-propeller fold protein YncE
MDDEGNWVRRRHQADTDRDPANKPATESDAGKRVRRRPHGSVVRAIVLVTGLTMLLPILGGGLSQSVAAGTPVQKGTIPVSTTNGHAGLYAWGAATMPDGSVIVGDYWNGRVVHYATDGTNLGVLFSLNDPGSPMTGNDAPYGLAVDQHTRVIYVGTYYINPSAPSVIQRWVPDPITGVYSQISPIAYSGFNYPSRVAVANDGTVYVADMRANRIFVFGSSGTFKFSWGGTGSGSGQFNQPRGIGFDRSSPQRLYVADANNNRVQVFDTSGTFLFKFGSVGKKQNQFRGNLRGLAVDPARNAVYVVDDASNYVYKFDLAGNWLAVIGGPGGLSQITCCSTPGGKFSNGGREATVDGNGNLWVADMPNFRVQVFNPAGQFLFAEPSPPENPPDGAFNEPRGVGVDSAGNVIVADTHNFRIEKFNSARTWQWSEGYRGGNSGYSMNYPGGVGTDPSDNSILIADTENNQIKKFDSNGVFIWTAGKHAGNGPGIFNQPSDVAVGSDGKVYVADTFNARVQVLDGADGHFLRAFGSKASAGGLFSAPTGITLDRTNQNIYVADPGRRLVFVFANDGTLLRSIGTGKLKKPYDVAVSATSVFVSDRNLDQVLIFNKADGSYVGAYGGPGAGAGKFQDPQGIEIGPDGFIYVADTSNDRIDVFQP